MAETDDKKKEVKQEQKVYTYADFLQFEPKNLYSGFGQMQVSTKQTQPCFGFGTSNRQQAAKVFQSKELSKTAFIGKASLGPKYQVTDKYSYKQDPQWKFGTKERNTLETGQKYDYYQRQDVDYFPIDADLSRRSKSQTAKIGLESRFVNDPKRQKQTPGPQYDPSLRHDIPNSQKYSFGFKRELAGSSPLVPMISTPAIVGPGSYIRNKKPDTSEVQIAPKYTFPKDVRRGPELRDWTINQTYDTKQQSVGDQVNSTKKTMPKVSFGKSVRDAKTGIFKNQMANQPIKVCIPMPK